MSYRFKKFINAVNLLYEHEGWFGLAHLARLRCGDGDGETKDKKKSSARALTLACDWPKGTKKSLNMQLLLQDRTTCCKR